MEDGDYDEAVGRGRFYRTTGRDCDYCETTRGSVTVDRSDDSVRCDTCHNDSETFPDDNLTNGW